MVAFLAVAGYCVARLAAAHRLRARYPGCHRALDIAHLVMALGMAVMCSPVGGPVPAAGWQTAYLLIAVWFLGSAWGSRRSDVRPEPIGWHGGGLHHAAAAVAMLYMITVGPHDARRMAAPWMGAHQVAPGLPLLGWIFAGSFVGCAILLGQRVGWPAPGGTGLPAILLAPRIAAGCQVTMAIGMTYMIIPID